VLVAPAALLAAGTSRQPVGDVMVTVRGDTGPNPGDTVRVTGRLDLPRDRPDFKRRAYLAQQGAFLEMRSARLTVVAPAEGGLAGVPSRLRGLYGQAITSILPQPDAALLVAVVLGVRQGIPPRLRQDLIATGLVHLLVLSGLKVAVFARLTTAALRPLMGRLATAPVLLLVGLYCLAGGGTPAAVRASVMGGLLLIGEHLGRPTHVWTSLAACGGAMLGLDPGLLWDVGFQLSFAGTAAIVLLTPGVERRVCWLPNWFREPFAVTCAAQLGTVPLMAAGFHVLSPVAPIANALVLPMLPLMVGAGLLLAPLAVVSGMGRVLALPLDAVLHYLGQVASVLARLPLASISVPAFPAWAGVAYYLGLGGALAAGRAEGGTRRALVSLAVLGPLLITVFELGAWAHPAPSAVVLDVGAGQAVLLRGPSGDVLVDGGSDPTRLASALGVHLPPWEHELAGLVITGGGIGHVGGLVGLGYGVDQLFVPDGNPPGTAWRAVALSQVVRGAGLHPLRAGTQLDLAGLQLQVLAPEATEAPPGQMALRVRGPASSLCDLADLDVDQQLEAAARLREPCDALLLPGGAAPVPELLAAAHPGRFIVSGNAPKRTNPALPPASLSSTGQEGDIEVGL
jgi:competence protein ComEC